jgi:O-antigen/teichoic acid export membrane protein
MTSRPGNFTNTFWNMLDTMIYPVSFLAFTPFFLHHLGEKMFGVYMLSVSIIFSLQILNLGLGTATLRNVARFLKTGDYTAVNETINTNFSFSLILFSICAVAGFVILLLVRYQGLFHIENSLKDYVSICLFIASLTGGLRFFEQIVQFTYKGFNALILRPGLICRYVLAAW